MRISSKSVSPPITTDCHFPIFLPNWIKNEKVFFFNKKKEEEESEQRELIASNIKKANHWKDAAAVSFMWRRCECTEGKGKRGSREKEREREH